MVEVYSIVAVIFGLIFISISLVKLKHQTISQNTFVIWAIIGFVGLAMGVFPVILEIIQNILGTQLSISTVVIVSFAVLFGIVFYLHQKVDLLNQRITKLISEMAANRFYKDPQKDDDQE